MNHHYGITFNTTGTTTITIYDKAGNSSDTRTHQIMYMRVNGNSCGNTWLNDRESNFFPQFGIVQNMGFSEDNGNLIIKASPYTGQGRVGCWHTNEYISISSDYDKIRALTWGNRTGVPIEIRVSNGNPGGVAVATTTTGDASSSGGYWIRPEGDITSYRGNRQIAIGMNGSENTSMEMYIVSCYVYSF